MEGYEVVKIDEVASMPDIFVTATGNIDVITTRPYEKNERSSNSL